MWQKLLIWRKFCSFATVVKDDNIVNMNERLIISANIKRLREASKFTQDQVSQFLGIGRSAYANYETGDRELPLDVMERLADLYGCDMFLLYEQDADVVKNMLATAFRVDNLSAEDMKQIADFKSLVKSYLKMDMLLEK